MDVKNIDNNQLPIRELTFAIKNFIKFIEKYYEERSIHFSFNRNYLVTNTPLRKTHSSGVLLILDENFENNHAIVSSSMEQWTIDKKDLFSNAFFDQFKIDFTVFLKEEKYHIKLTLLDEDDIFDFDLFGKEIMSKDKKFELKVAEKSLSKESLNYQCYLIKVTK